MRGLLLVDLDNVLGDRNGGRGLSAFVREASGTLVAKPNVREWIAAFVLNTQTAFDHELTFAALRGAGEALGKAAGGRRTITEIALALTMPQAADVLLARLGREAPSADAAGPYHAAMVLTADRGLVAGLAQELYQAPARRWIGTCGPNGLGMAWQMPDGGPPLVRRYLAARTAGQGHEPVLANAFTICIQDPAVGAWAAARPVDVEATQELWRVALWIEREPWALSQLGATSKCLRGIDRLRRFPASQPIQLGEVGSRDGLEVRGKTARPTRGGNPSPASVGIGAVRFDDRAATVASRISADVLGSHLATYQLDRVGLNVRAALQQLPADSVLGDKRVKVRLTRRGRDLAAKVHHGSTSQPQAWWITGETTVRSELRMPCGELLPGELVVTAAPMRPSCRLAIDRRTIRLALCAPVVSGERLRIDEHIDKGTIGLGWTVRERERPRPIGIFSPYHPLSAGEDVFVEQIRRVPRTRTLSGLPEALWALPLVVPQAVE